MLTAGEGGKMDPIRRIVVLQPHEWLYEGFSTRNFAASAPELERKITTRGMRFDALLPPSKVPDFGFSGVGQLRGKRLDFEGTAGAGYALAAEFEDEEALERFASDRNEEIRGIFSDPTIAPFPVVSPTGAIGSDNDVRQKLNLASLHSAQFDGRGVKLMIVDTGIDQSRVGVSGGFSPNPAVSPGNSPPDHGTMVAFDACIAAPRAMVFDYPLLKSTDAGQWVGLLSDAIRVFSEIMIAVLQTPGPAVVVNSWGMYNRSQDAPVGNPQNYSANPRHPFNQLVTALIGAGVDVVFASGNCGSTYPDTRCGSSDRGPGNSIHGANSHPEVITVGAVTINDDALGYSSEGPGGLASQKPDVAGFSHFVGSGVYPVDSGTSAACPVVAGVVAALRSKPGFKSLAPAQLKAVLMKSARDVGAPGWDPQTGWGVVDAGAALTMVP
ncbi:MAG: S8 family serine peptidase [Deltaproteobacteria bacterium]|nr:S8 family serine peptidase [Deltaproteobacteria bacterium]